MDRETFGFLDELTKEHNFSEAVRDMSRCGENLTRGGTIQTGKHLLAGLVNLPASPRGR
jgi:hypothetical protein